MDLAALQWAIFGGGRSGMAFTRLIQMDLKANASLLPPAKHVRVMCRPGKPCCGCDLKSGTLVYVSRLPFTGRPEQCSREYWEPLHFWQENEECMAGFISLSPRDGAQNAAASLGFCTVFHPWDWLRAPWARAGAQGDIHVAGATLA